KLRVTGAWREVDEQDVELTPAHVLNELLHGLHDHGPAPHHRRVLINQETHAHHLHPVRFHRDEEIAVDLRTARDADHERYAGPVDIAIHQPDAERAAVRRAQLRECAGEIDGECALA